MLVCQKGQRRPTPEDMTQQAARDFQIFFLAAELAAQSCAHFLYEVIKLIVIPCLNEKGALIALLNPKL